MVEKFSFSKWLLSPRVYRLSQTEPGCYPTPQDLLTAQIVLSCKIPQLSLSLPNKPEHLTSAQSLLEVKLGLEVTEATLVLAVARTCNNLDVTEDNLKLDSSVSVV